jgi:hypothetical protein
VAATHKTEFEIIPGMSRTIQQWLHGTGHAFSREAHEIERELQSKCAAFTRKA